MRKGGKEDEGGRPRRRWGFVELRMWMSEVYSHVDERGVLGGFPRKGCVRHDDCASIYGSLMVGRDVDTYHLTWNLSSLLPSTT